MSKFKIIKAFILLLTSVICICSASGCDKLKVERNNDRENNGISQTNNRAENRARKHLKDGGSLIVFIPDVENPEDIASKDIDIVEHLIRTRLDSNGYPEATIKTDTDGNIAVAIPDCDIPDDVADILKTPSVLEFIDADGNVIMEGSSEHLKKAEPKHGQTSENSDAQYYIEISFTKAGREKFKEATQKAVVADADKQFISIALDGSVQMAPRINEVIDSDTCILSGEYTKESAQDIAKLINSGTLPFKLKIIKLEYIKP